MCLCFVLCGPGDPGKNSWLFSLYCKTEESDLKLRQFCFLSFWLTAAIWFVLKQEEKSTESIIKHRTSCVAKLEMTQSLYLV